MDNGSFDEAPRQRRGLIVLIVLAVLTIVEYIIAVTVVPGSLLYLIVFAVAKAGIIGWYFMHMAQIWGREE